MEQREITKYSDFKVEKIFSDVERVDGSTVLNKEIIILDFKGLPSTIAENKEFCVIKADVDGKLISFSSGEVVLRQLTDVKEGRVPGLKLPMKTTIIKVKGKGKFGYYSLS